MAVHEVPPESHLPLHPLEFQILLVLGSGAIHAYALVQEIEARQPDWHRILPTNLYRRIRRLAKSGLIEEVPGEPSPDGRSRTYYDVTALGRRVALAESERLRGLLVEAEQAGLSPEGRSGS